MPPSSTPQVPAASAVASSSKPTRSSKSAAVPSDLPPSFSSSQAQKAVNALITHAAKVAKEKEETELIPKDEHVWLSVALKHGAIKKKMMPVTIPLPHPPLPPPPATSVCLLVKDPQREYKDLLDAKNIKFISRVVGVTKLKGKFKPFEARRQLMAEHEMFLCDERVMGMMPGLLGAKFYEAKKVPIPVNLKHQDLKNELAKAIASTYFIPTTGTQVSVRVATLNVSTPAQTLENLLTAIPLIASQQKGGWDNILSLGIKTSSSVLLPIWSSALADRFEVPQAQKDEEVRAQEGKKKRKSVFEEYRDEQKLEDKRGERARRLLAGEAVEEEEAVPVESKGKKGKKGKKSKKEANGVSEEVSTKAAAAPAAPAAETVPKVDKVIKGDKAELAVKKAGKKSSTIGSGGAGKRSKEAILGKAR